MKFGHKKKLETALSYGENLESLISPGLESVYTGTPGRTDRITIASTRLALYAVARKDQNRREHSHGVPIFTLKGQ